jgi:hypothetical protein
MRSDQNPKAVTRKNRHMTKLSHTIGTIVPSRRPPLQLQAYDSSVTKEMTKAICL